VHVSLNVSKGQEGITDTLAAKKTFGGLFENHDFVGRVDILANLKTRFTTNQHGIISQRLAGLGGVGKSTLAREFARVALQEKRYDFVLWLHAKSSQSLFSDFKQLALRQGMPAELSQVACASFIIDFVYEKLSCYERLLIIFDDAPDMQVLRTEDANYLPPSSAHHVRHWLVTTKNQQFSLNSQDMIPLESFSSAEASDYILKHLSTEVDKVDSSTAESLAATLHYFPLALAQAVAFIKVRKLKDEKTPVSEHITNYVKVYKSNRKERRRRLNLSVAEDFHKESVYSTWKMAIDALRKEAAPGQTPLAERILNVCSYLFSNDIPLSLLQNTFAEEGEGVVDTALDALTRYSLINQEGDSLGIHGLVQTVIQLQLEEDYPTSSAAAAQVLEHPIDVDIKKLLSALTTSMKDWFHSTEQERVALRHVEHVRSLLQHHSHWPRSLKESVDYMALLSWWINVRRAVRNEDTEGIFYDDLIKLTQHFVTQIPPPAELVFSYFVLAANKRDLSQTRDAQTFLNLGFNVATSLGLTKTIEGYLLQAMQGDIHFANKFYSEAEICFKKALEQVECLALSSSREKSMLFNRLGKGYFRQQRYSEAEQYFTQSLTMEESANPAPSESKGVTLHVLGRVYLAQQRLSEAEQYFTQSLTMKESANPAPSESKGVTLHELGNIFLDQQRYSEAEQYFTQSLTMEESANPAPSESKGVTLHALGNVFLDQQRLSEAEQYFTQSLTMKESADPAPSESKGLTLHALGNIFLNQQRYSEAEQYFTQSLTMEESANPAPSESKGVTLHELGNIFLDQQRYSEAEQYFTQSLAMKESANPAPSESKGVTLHVLGRVYLAQQRLSEAEQYFTQSLAMKESANPAPSESKGVTLHVLGRVYLAQQRYSEAEQYFTQSLAMKESADPAPSKPKTTKRLALGIVELMQQGVAEADNPCLLYERLGDTYCLQSEYAMAIESFTEVLRYLPQRNVLQSEAYSRIGLKKRACEAKVAANLAHQMGITHYAAENWADAIIAFQQGLEKNQLFFKEQEHEDLALSHWWLSSCYLKQANYTQALVHVEKAYTLRSTLFAEGAELTQKAKERLTQCGEALTNCTLSSATASIVENRNAFYTRTEVNPVTIPGEESHLPNTSSF
jgi:tetratricopeptide (TPR) repeat protein